LGGNRKCCVIEFKRSQTHAPLPEAQPRLKFLRISKNSPKYLQEKCLEVLSKNAADS
jgi:hypothetical protein